MKIPQGRSSENLQLKQSGSSVKNGFPNFLLFTEKMHERTNSRIFSAVAALFLELESLM